MCLHVSRVSVCMCGRQILAVQSPANVHPPPRNIYMTGREPSPFGGGGMDWASLPGKARSDLPASVLFNGREVSIYTFAQIDRLGKRALKERAMNLRDLVGAQHLPRFSPGYPDEQMVAWLMEAQTIVAAASGVHITVGDLGAPTGGDGVGAFLAHLQDSAASPLFQQAPPPFQQQRPPLFQQQQQQQQQHEEVYVLETILDVRIDARGLATHFLCKFENHPVEEATWEPAEQIQEVAPRQAAAFKQRLMQQRQQQQQSPPHQHRYQPPPSAPYQPQYQQQPTPPSRQSNASSSAIGSPMRPDQESDAVREAARRRNQGSFAFG